MDQLEGQLRDFEKVWKRVGAAKSLRSAAEERGLSLMPGKDPAKAAKTRPRSGRNGPGRR